MQSIVPKLAGALQGLEINPAGQDMRPFEWVVAWADVMPAPSLAAILELGFFPKWHAVLHYWLSATPNYDEVTRWYLGWKSSFPPALLDAERVRAQFTAALDAMNSAVDGRTVPAAAAGRWAGDGGAAAAAAAAPAAPAAPIAPPSTGRPAPELTLKELVQRFAEEHDVSFMPKFGRFQDGLQVFSFGGVSCVLDSTGGVVRAQLGVRWAPVSLDTLLTTARASKA